MKVLIFSLLLFSTHIYASIPSLEGLMRNPSNRELDKELVVAHIIVKRTAADSDFNDDTAQVNTNFFKYLLVSSENEDDFKKMIAVEYENGSYDVGAVSDIKKATRIEGLLTNDNTKNILQSLILSYTFNSSYGFNKIFKSIEENYKSNSELINKDKASLIEEYKKFLVKKKEYEEKVKEYEDVNTAAPVSPLDADGEQKQAEIKNIMNSSLYRGTNNLKLIKRNREFVWSINLDNIKGEFKNDTHQLVFLELHMSDDVYTIVPRSYVTYNGRYTLPKYIEVKNSTYKYLIEIPTYYLLNSANKSIAERRQEYIKFKERNDQRESAQVSIEGEEVQEKVNLLF